MDEASLERLPIRLALEAATGAVNRTADHYVEVFSRGDLSVGLYAPHGADTQEPHDQDELYIVAAGSGSFKRADELVRFARGDVLFVAAGVSHAFLKTTVDFRAWVVFFGARVGLREPNQDSPR